MFHTRKLYPSLSHKLDNITRNNSLSSEGDKVYLESIYRGDSCVHFVVRGSVGLIKHWKSQLTKGVKGNTIMGKLLAARLEGQKYCSNTGKSSFGSIREDFDEKARM